MEKPEHEKVKDAATSLHCRQLFINASSGPSIIHQCADNKGGEGCSPRCCFTKVMTMKPDGRGGGGVWRWSGGDLAFREWMEKEEEGRAGEGWWERGHKENKPSGLIAPAVELPFLMRPPLPAV